MPGMPPRPYTGDPLLASWANQLLDWITGELATRPLPQQPDIDHPFHLTISGANAVKIGANRSDDTYLWGDQITVHLGDGSIVCPALGAAGDEVTAIAASGYIYYGIAKLVPSITAKHSTVWPPAGAGTPGFSNVLVLVGYAVVSGGVVVDVVDLLYENPSVFDPEWDPSGDVVDEGPGINVTYAAGVYTVESLLASALGSIEITPGAAGWAHNLEVDEDWLEYWLDTWLPLNVPVEHSIEWSATPALHLKGDVATPTEKHIYSYISARGWNGLDDLHEAGDGLEDAFDGVGVLLHNVLYQYSIDLDAATNSLELVNDEDAPGNYQVYGSGSAGAKGWFDAPWVNWGVDDNAVVYRNGDAVDVAKYDGLWIGNRSKSIQHLISPAVADSATYGWTDFYAASSSGGSPTVHYYVDDLGHIYKEDSTYQPGPTALYKYQRCDNHSIVIYRAADDGAAIDIGDGYCWERLSTTPVFTADAANTDTLVTAFDSCSLCAAGLTNYVYEDCDSVETDLIFASNQGATILVSGVCYSYARMTSAAATDPVPTVTSTHADCAACAESLLANRALHNCSGGAVVGYIAKTDDPAVDYFYAKKSGTWYDVYKGAGSASAVDIDCLYLDELDATPASCSDLTQNRHGAVYATGTCVLDTAQYKFGSSSLRFDSGGGGSNIVSDDFVVGTGAFSVEVWYKSNGSHSDATGILTVGGYGTSQNLRVNLNDSGGAIIVWWDSNGSDGGKRVVAGSPGAYTDGTWRHFRVDRSGTTITVYVNGSSVGSATYSGNIGTSGQVNGCGGGGAGWVDEYRFSDTSRGSSVPSAALSPDANTMALCHLEGPDESACFFDSALA